MNGYPFKLEFALQKFLPKIINYVCKFLWIININLMGRIFNYFEFTFSYTLTNLFRSVDRIDGGSSCRCKLYFGRGI